MRNFGRFQRDRRVPRAIKALWAFLADAEAPVGGVTKREDESRIVGRLRGWGTRGKLLCWRWLLTQGEGGQAWKEHGWHGKKGVGPLRHTVDASARHCEEPP